MGAVDNMVADMAAVVVADCDAVVEVEVEVDKLVRLHYFVVDTQDTMDFVVAVIVLDYIDVEAVVLVA